MKKLLFLQLAVFFVVACKPTAIQMANPPVRPSVTDLTNARLMQTLPLMGVTIYSTDTCSFRVSELQYKSIVLPMIHFFHFNFGAVHIDPNKTDVILLGQKTGTKPELLLK